MADDLSRDPIESELSDEDYALRDYVSEYGLATGLALFKEDYGLPLSQDDVSALSTFARADETELDLSPVRSSDYGDLTDSDTEIGEQIDRDVYPDIADLDFGDYDRFEPDIGLDLSPGYEGFEPYSLHYEMYLNDGSIIEGDVDIYHEDTDVEDVIYAANEDVDYGDVVYVNYG